MIALKKIIINADDFGLSKGITDGIIKCINEGIVTSTTLLVNGENVDYAIEKANSEKLNVGIHLTLTYGKPLLPKEEVSNLIDQDGNFIKIEHKKSKTLFLTEETLIQIKNEFRKQIETAINKGLNISHFDSHHHVHFLPFINKIVVSLGKEFNKPIRSGKRISKSTLKGIKTTNYFSESFYGENATKENLIQIMESFENGNLEIMSHPGYIYDLKGKTKYLEDREREMDILLDNEIKNYILEKEIKLISYNDL